MRVLDPCAGTGEPAAALARALGAEGYGIELNDERAAQCRVRLDHLLATSALYQLRANPSYTTRAMEARAGG